MHQPMVDTAASTAVGPRRPRPGSHVVVLAYPHSGAEELWSLLAGHPSLACTAGTELIPLCDQAARAWRSAEASGSTLTTMAAASVRAMTGSVITVIKSRAGRERWCEVTTAPAQSARAFLQLYPDTRVICLHRSCADVVAAASRAGARKPDLSPFAAAHPGNPVAAAAAYWRDRTGQLLELERDKPGQCRRVRYEDLLSAPAEADRVLGFLGLTRYGAGLGPVPGRGAGRNRDGGGSGDGRNGDSRNGDGRNGDGRNGDSRNGDSRNGDSRNGDGRNGDGGLSGVGPCGSGRNADRDGNGGAGGNGGRGGNGDGRNGGGRLGPTGSGVASPPEPSLGWQHAAIAARLPGPLLEQVNLLQAELSYPALGDVPADRSPRA